MPRARLHSVPPAEYKAGRLSNEPPALPNGRQAVAHGNDGFAQVVYQLKQIEQPLEDQPDLVRLIIDNSPNLVFVEDEMGKCVLANKRYTQLLAQQVVLVSKQELPAGETEGPDAPNGAGVLASEECYRLGSGQVLWFSTTKVPLIWANGTRYLLTFSSDITDLKQAHRLAEESVRSRQNFLASMSHEIRTPLHGVMGLVDLLKKEPLSVSQQDYADLIQSSTERLLVVINDILDFTKIESGNIQLESIPFDIAKTVREAVRLLSFKMEEKGLMLQFEGVDGTLPLVQGDPFRLHQIIVNLVSNAIKFTPRGTITITAEAHPNADLDWSVTFRVADTGIGISADNLEHIFRGFQQGNSSISRLYGGTGLGLSICKNLVALQGGHLTVESQLGQGSCFSFTIPYAASEALPPQKTPVVQEPHLLDGVRMLLVEDDGINQLIAMSMLGQWQVEVDMAQNGEEALVKASQQRYDIILMDIQMPHMDGFEATQRIRTGAGPNRTTPIVALTADAVRMNWESCQATGFTDYLLKPYSQETLYDLLVRTSREVPALPLGKPAPKPVLTRSYDLESLGRLALDTSFIRQLLDMFVTSVPGRVQTMQEALAAGNWGTAGREAHGLKTIFSTLNIQPEANYLGILEEMIEKDVTVAASHPFVQAVVQGTAQFVELFTTELACLPAE